MNDDWISPNHRPAPPVPRALGRGSLARDEGRPPHHGELGTSPGLFQRGLQGIEFGLNGRRAGELRIEGALEFLDRLFNASRDRPRSAVNKGAVDALSDSGRPQNVTSPEAHANIEDLAALLTME